MFVILKPETRHPLGKLPVLTRPEKSVTPVRIDELALRVTCFAATPTLSMAFTLPLISIVAPGSKGTPSPLTTPSLLTNLWEVI